MQFQLNKLMLAAAVLVIAGVVTPLVLLKPWKQSSQEMKALQGMEQKMALPEPTFKQADDRGHWQEKDGTGHMTRRITYSYTTHDAVKQAEKSIRAMPGWSFLRPIKVDGTKEDTVVLNTTARACIELRSSTLPSEQDSDGATNRVVLMAESDDACSGYLASY